MENKLNQWHQDDADDAIRNINDWLYCDSRGRVDYNEMLEAIKKDGVPSRSEIELLVTGEEEKTQDVADRYSHIINVINRQR